MDKFTDGELEVMTILWEHGEQKPGDIREKFDRPIKDPALRSYLTILVEKGHVTRRRVGKAFIYRAKTPRESAFRSTIRKLVDTYCNGSTEALIARLIKTEELSEEELLNLKALAEEEPVEDSPSKGKKS